MAGWRGVKILETEKLRSKEKQNSKLLVKWKTKKGEKESCWLLEQAQYKPRATKQMRKFSLRRHVTTNVTDN